MDEEEEVVTVNVWRRRLKTMTFDDGGNADQDNVRMKTLKMTARREMAATTTSLPLLLFCEGEINAFTATRARFRETRCALKGLDHPCIVFGLFRVRRAPPLGFVKDLKNLGFRV